MTYQVEQTVALGPRGVLVNGGAGVTFGTKEELYRAVMDQLTYDLADQVTRAAPTVASFEETVVTLAEALWRTALEQPASYQLRTEPGMFAMRTPTLRRLFRAPAAWSWR